MVRIWDPTTGAQVREALRGHEGLANSVAMVQIDGAARVVSGARTADRRHGPQHQGPLVDRGPVGRGYSLLTAVSYSAASLGLRSPQTRTSTAPSR
jgi:hypothetical protein